MFLKSVKTGIVDLVQAPVISWQLQNLWLPHQIL